jgi:putative two-component system response regulator
MSVALSAVSPGIVLAVDDQPENLMLLDEVLGGEGLTVRLAADGAAALKEVARQHPDCIVLDVMMPGVDGFAVLRELKGRRDTSYIPIVMLTALTSVEDKVQAYELGADDFLNKPVNIHELIARVGSLIRIKRLRDELDTSESIIVSMVQALESKDPRSAGHSQRVAVTAADIARRLGLGGELLELVTKGGLLHDIGRIGLSERLLRPQAELDGAERIEFQQHAVLGERILAPFLSFARVRTVVRQHHERFDGSGYPDGLAGDDLEVTSEIVALANHADVLAMSLPSEAVVEELRRLAGRRTFRPELVDALLSSPDTPALTGGAPPPWQELLPLPGTVRPGRVLLGDDIKTNRDFLTDTLTSDGHSVTTVSTANELLRAVEEQKPDLVFVDVRLPGGDGFALCSSIKSRPETEFLPVILATSQRDLTSRYSGAGPHADDFLLLPINRLELLARVKSLLRLRMFFKDLEDQVSVILSLASALEAKDPYTHGHSERVGVLAAQLGRMLGMTEPECHLLLVAGQLHDIGKIGMPERVLNKEGRLDDAELRVVRQHSELGELICRPLRTMRSVLTLIRHHHERFDGTGYPDRLSGESIPIGARILSLADAYDALTSARSYRQSYPSTDAIELLARETAEGRWDPSVFASLEMLVRRGLGS